METDMIKSDLEHQQDNRNELTEAVNNAYFALGTILTAREMAKAPRTAATKIINFRSWLVELEAKIASDKQLINY